MLYSSLEAAQGSIIEAVDSIERLLPDENGVLDSKNASYQTPDEMNLKMNRYFQSNFVNHQSNDQSFAQSFETAANNMYFGTLSMENDIFTSDKRDILSAADQSKITDTLYCDDTRDEKLKFEESIGKYSKPQDEHSRRNNIRATQLKIVPQIINIRSKYYDEDLMTKSDSYVITGGHMSPEWDSDSNLLQALDSSALRRQSSPNVTANMRPSSMYNLLLQDIDPKSTEIECSHDPSEPSHEPADSVSLPDNAKPNKTPLQESKVSKTIQSSFALRCEDEQDKTNIHFDNSSFDGKWCNSNENSFRSIEIKGVDDTEKNYGSLNVEFTHKTFLAKEIESGGSNGVESVSVPDMLFELTSNLKISQPNNYEDWKKCSATDDEIISSGM